MYSYCNMVLNSTPQYKQFRRSSPCTSPHTTQTNPLTGSLIFFVSAKILSNLSSISNSAEHSGQVVFPRLSSILWFRQKGHFKFSGCWGLSKIMCCLLRAYINSFASSFDFSSLGGPINDAPNFSLIKSGFRHQGGCINPFLGSFDNIQHLIGCRQL